MPECRLNDPAVLAVVGIPQTIDAVVPMPSAPVMERILEALGDAHAHRHGDGNSHSNSHLHGNANKHCDPNGHRHGDRNANANGHSHAGTSLDDRSDAAPELPRQRTDH